MVAQFRRVADGEEGDGGDVERQIQNFFCACGFDPADPAGAEPALLRREDKVFARNAEVDVFIMDSGKKRGEKMSPVSFSCRGP